MQLLERCRKYSYKCVEGVWTSVGTLPTHRGGLASGSDSGWVQSVLFPITTSFLENAATT